MSTFQPVAREITVIEVVFNRGIGTFDDPVRRVTAYHDFDGNVLAENDPIADSLDDREEFGYYGSGYVPPFKPKNAQELADAYAKTRDYLRGRTYRHPHLDDLAEETIGRTAC